MTLTSDSNLRWRILPRPPLGMFYEPPGATLPVGPTVRVGVIGLGAWGREIIRHLARLPNAPVVAVCDHYASALQRTAELAPSAAQFPDYRQLLESSTVQAVIVATPTHQHRQIVLDAVSAGKHVYCEAPLAHTIEDARAIALAAMRARTVFQSGLQLRRNPHRRVQAATIREGGIGRPVFARAQFHRKTSWAFASPNPDCEKEINWRIQNPSIGLIGEAGIHQLDLFSWFLNARPQAVTGTGSALQWTDDNREIFDTVQAVFEYPGGVNLLFNATLGNSFDAETEVLHGSSGALLMRNGKAWLVKESDASTTAWEDWARREYIFGQLGFVLRVGNDEDAYPESPLYYALQAFAARVGFAPDHADMTPLIPGAVAADDPLKLSLAAGWKEGFEATVMVIKANEAIQQKRRIGFDDDCFKIS